MAKFTAPDSDTEIALPEIFGPVIDGLIEVQAPTVADIATLRVAGFTLVAQGAYFAMPADEPVDPEVEI